MDNNRNQIIALYDIYRSLLTEKQRLYFEDYYYSDLSISEIAENYNISRNGVHDQIKRATQALYEYEEKLKISQKLDKIFKLDIDKEILEKISNIIMED
ncbi:MAG: DNA-binding protein [Acholeplasmatales bacterium]|nr:DNA-binding protein [Acholeplasmatales bacterium]